ncbi:MAG: phosphoribosyltransferase [Halofilum sp. (in: g-proteobacteria)]
MIGSWIFSNREEAGRELAETLARRNPERPVVLALPRGGVPVGAEIARALDAPLDLLLVRKLGVPHQPELALGAVIDGEHPELVVNEDVRRYAAVSDAELERLKTAEVRELERRRERYLRGRAPIPVEDRTVIVVDDGIATGATARAALVGLRRREPKRLILAVPVAPPDTVRKLRNEVDELVCLETPSHFGAIGAFYQDFDQVTDEEVIALLSRHAPPGGSSGASRS